jgi:hypothetical protein
MSTIEGLLPSGQDTLLTICGEYWPGEAFQYQARGLTQTIGVSKLTQQQKRTIDGTMVDVSNPAMRKFTSKITCTDVDAPPLDGLWPGMEITIECAAEFVYKTGNPASPCRMPVSGSSYTQNGYTFYRPVLICMVMDLSHQLDEWKHDNGWTLDVEEV